MSEIYRVTKAAPPGIEPGKAMQQTKPQLCVIAHDVADKTRAANSAESVSSRTIPPRSKNLGPDYGPTALLTAVVRYMAECGCTPGDLTKMAAVREGRPATVYFVQGVDGGPIKIGHTNKLAYRLDTLQAHSPVRLRLLGTMASTIEMELALHAYFTASRLHGEWFRPTPELMAFIAEFARPSPEPSAKASESDAALACSSGASVDPLAGGGSEEPASFGDSSSGRTAAFEAVNPGSIPGSPAVPDEGSFNGRTASSDLADVGSIPAPSASALHAHVRGEPPGERHRLPGNRRRLGSSQDAGHSGPPWASSAESFLARSVHIAPDWRARLPAGVTVEMVEQDLAPKAVGR